MPKSPFKILSILPHLSTVQCQFGLLKHVGPRTYDQLGNYSFQWCRGYLFEDVWSKRKSPDLIYKDKASIAVGITTLSKIERIKEIINFAEDELKIEQKTRFIPTAIDKLYIARIDPIWVKKTYLTSLWSLIIRISNGVPTTKSPKEFLATYVGDQWMGNYIGNWGKDKYDYFVKKGIYLQPDEEEAEHIRIHGSHGYGIQSVVLPVVKEIKVEE